MVKRLLSPKLFGVVDVSCGSQLFLKDTAAHIGSYEQAAPSFEGAHYAYNFINKVGLEKRQNVLVNGATGAIGSAAVQLLKYFGANVTAVCATTILDLLHKSDRPRLILGKRGKGKGKKD